MKKLLAMFFLGFGTLFLLRSLVGLLGSGKGSATGAIGLAVVFYSVGYVLWPIQKKKRILDRILGGVFSLVGLLTMVGTLRHLEGGFRGVLVVAFSIAILVIGIAVFLKKSTEPSINRLTEQPPPL